MKSSVSFIMNCSLVPKHVDIEMHNILWQVTFSLYIIVRAYLFIYFSDMWVCFIICEFYFRIVKSVLQNKWLITTGLHKERTSLWFSRIFQLYNQSIQGRVDITFLLSESISSVPTPSSSKSIWRKENSFTGK